MKLFVEFVFLHCVIDLIRSCDSITLTFKAYYINNIIFFMLFWSQRTTYKNLLVYAYWKSLSQVTTPLAIIFTDVRGNPEHFFIFSITAKSSLSLLKGPRQYRPSV